MTRVPPSVVALGPSRARRLVELCWRAFGAALGAAAMAGAGCSCNGETQQACKHVAGPPSKPAGSPDAGSSVDFCASCGAPAVGGSLASSEIREASGIVASTIHPDVFYVHNDSGDRARFFAIDKTGADRGTFEVKGAANLDWEDAARGPCGTGACLYFGDIGGGKSKARAELTLYRFPEPAELGPGSHSVTAEALPLSYPDGAFDAETLLIHPKTGVITLVTKVKSGHSSIFEVPMPLSPGKAAVLVRVGDVGASCGSPRFTGGDVHPEGLGVLLRTYTDVFFYPMRPDQTVAQALAGTACVLLAPSESHGEAIAWLPSGRGFVTVSEGVGSPVSIASCTPGQ